MTSLRLALLFFALSATQALVAKEVAGVAIPDKASTAGQTLLLNGAGIRSKFIFDIYVGALYLPQKTQQAMTAIQMSGAKRVTMHFLYDEVEKEKLTDGWISGFENNLDEKQFKALMPRLTEFNKLFITVKKGDQIILDYAPKQGTSVIINGKLAGTIPGADFNQALLLVWLGSDPADEDLKAAMLGN